MDEDVHKPPAPPPDEAVGNGPDQKVMRRAEAMVDGAGERIGHFASLLGQRLRRMAARAREEAEDVWAEAQSIRRRNGPR